MDSCNWRHRRRNLLKHLIIFGSIVLILAACTRGRVIDSDDNDEFIGGAEVEFFEWPHNSSASNPWPLFSAPSADYTVETHTDGFEGRDYNWAIKDYSGSGCISSAVKQDTVVASENEDMFRFRIDKEGYRPSFYYEYHPEGVADEVYDCQNAEWIDPYPVFTYDDFELWPENPQNDDHPMLPDIMPDKRDLENHIFDCAILEGSPKVQSVTLRPDASWANIGYGAFNVRLEVQSGTPQEFVQEVDLNDGGSIDIDLGVDILEWHPAIGHNHFHMKEWSTLRLLDSSSQCNDLPENRPPSCEVTEGQKVAACVISLEEFDQEIFAEYGDSFDQNCLPANGGTTELQPGYKDVYHYPLEGQAVRLGTPAGIDNIVPPGTYLLENHWDPTGFYEEEGMFRERNNKSARVFVEIPAFTTSTDQDACYGEEPTDCQDWQNALPTTQDWCRDHLRCETDDDCVGANHTCESVPGEPDDYCALS